MLDNIELIKPLLKFDSDDDFYYLQILQRKKDNPEIGANSRVIKNYYITSLEYLDMRYSEIKELCNHFNARASLRLNKRSFKRIAFKTLENIANTMQNENEYKHIRKSYDRACGLLHNQKTDKRWVLDFDHVSPDFVTEPSFIWFIEKLEPIGPKHLATIPSASGFHMITNPFNVEKFKRDFPHIDIHKDNPTNLYLP